MRERSRPSGITAAFQSAESALKRYLMRFFVRPQDIDDAVQETFLRAFESERSQTIRAPKSFLFKVAKNIALSEISRKTNQLMSCMGDIDALGVMDAKPSMEERMELDGRLEALSRVIESLPPQCRRVLLMRKVFGFSHKEIAHRLQISTKTVEKHLTKALQRCQQADREDTPEGEPAAPARVSAARSFDE